MALDAAHAALTSAGVRTRRDEPLARRGWWRVGGPADLWAEPGDARALRQCMHAAQAHGLGVTVLGNGSNLLVADAGIRGITLKLLGDFRMSEVIETAQGPVLIAGGGLMNTVLLNRLDKAGLHGLGCLAGVPGTLGGAVCMNAGTHLGEIGDRVQEVELVRAGGSVTRIKGAELGFRYRRADIPRDAVVSRVWLEVERDGLADAQAAVRDHLARRKATQPLDQPSCGSTFKNPPGDAAGRLIEAAGLKGHRIGGATISEKHANFFLNTGGATAQDLRSLIVHARDAVWEHFGVSLEPEVHAVGDWPPGAWPLPVPH